MKERSCFRWMMVTENQEPDGEREQMEETGFLRVEQVDKLDASG